MATLSDAEAVYTAGLYSPLVPDSPSRSHRRSSSSSSSSCSCSSSTTEYRSSCALLQCTDTHRATAADPSQPVQLATVPASLRRRRPLRTRQRRVHPPRCISSDGQRQNRNLYQLDRTDPAEATPDAPRRRPAGSEAGLGRRQLDSARDPDGRSHPESLPRLGACARVAVVPRFHPG